MPAFVINEVLYDPPGADTGWEFVEILNVSDVPQSLADLELQVADGARPGTWRSAWEGAATTLGPGELFVVGGDSLPQRQAPLSLSLQNGPDAVRLLQADVPLDLLGYGDLQAPELYETAPAPDVSAASLSRIPDGSDTNDNATDFRSTPPTPGKRNAPRRALRLALVAPDPTRLWPWRTLVMQVRVHNRGLEASEAGGYGVVASLHAVLGEPFREAWSLGASWELAVEGPSARMAPGDSATHRLRWHAELGLFLLRVSLQSKFGEATGPDSLFLRVGAGPIVVNEIYFAPESGQDEWVELFNRDVRAHDLNGWSLADATGRAAALRAAAPLAPGAYALLEAGAAVPGVDATVLRIRVTPWPSLNNSDGDDGFADQVILRDAAGIVQDALGYSATWSAGKGRSIERLTPDPDARGLLWAPCKDPEGSTPGRVNSATAPPGWHTQLDLQPNPFSPDGDGYQDLLAIAFEVPAGSLGFQLQLFDSAGRRRRHLAGDRLGPGPRRLFWDGADDGGRPVETGVYVLHLELLGVPGAAKQLRSIGVVRR